MQQTPEPDKPDQSDRPDIQQSEIGRDTPDVGAPGSAPP